VPFTSGPYTPVSGEPFLAENPAFSSGNLSSQAAVIKNISPFLLSVADGSGQVAALVDPYTTDLAPLDNETGQQLEITPVNLGLTPAASVPPLVYITWYNVQEQIPGSYPYALPLETIVNDITTPIPVITVGSMAYASLTGPGELVTPGALTQAGGLTINDDGEGVTINDTGGVTINDTGAGVAINDTGGVQVQDSAGVGISLHSFGASASNIGIEAQGATAYIGILSGENLELEATGTITIGTSAHTGIVNANPAAQFIANAGNALAPSAQLELDGGGNSAFWGNLITYIGADVTDSVKATAVTIKANDGIVVEALTADVEISSVLGNVRLAANSGSTSITIANDTSITINAALLGFFAASPVAPQVSGGTLAGAIAGLVALGLFSS